MIIMNEPDLESRIRRLERHNRALTAVIVGLLLVGCLAAVGPKQAQPQPPDGNFRIVRASKFEVLDPRTGLTRATLDHQVAPGGWAALHFYDAKGQPRAWFRLFEDGEADLALLDRASNIQASIAIDNQGQASSVVNRSTPYHYGEEMQRKGVKLDYRPQ
jgi:hypothetical protein